MSTVKEMIEAYVDVQVHPKDRAAAEQAITAIAREAARQALIAELDWPIIGEGNDEERHAKIVAAVMGDKQ